MGLGPLEGHREGCRGLLTCGQGWTPEGQEKQQPRLSHGPPERRQDPAADLRVGWGEEAATRRPRRPQAQLHLSCSTTEPFPPVRSLPPPAWPPNPAFSHQSRELGTPHSLPSEEHSTACKAFSQPLPLSLTGSRALDGMSGA